MTFNEKLKDLRTRKKLHQKDVAQSLGIDRTTYTKYETGKSEPDFETTQKLADFFGTSIDALLGRDEKPKEETYQVTLTEKDIKEIKRKAEGVKVAMINAVGMAFDGKPDDEETLAAVMAALEEGMMLAKKEAKEKYTPKKFRK